MLMCCFFCKHGPMACGAGLVENRETLGTAEKFSELRNLAFALSGPTLGQAGWGCAEFGGHVVSIPAPQWVSPFPLSSLPVSVPWSVGLQGAVVEDREGCVWAWSMFCSGLNIWNSCQERARSLPCSSLCWSSLISEVRSCYKLACGWVMRNN